jgi:hypothetical protein
MPNVLVCGAVKTLDVGSQVVLHVPGSLVSSFQSWLGHKKKKYSVRTTIH